MLTRCANVVTGLSVALVFACGVTDVGNADFEATEPFSFDISLSDRTVFRLVGINGSIDVDGDPAATSIRIDGERKVRSESISDAEESLDRLEVRITEGSNDVLVQTVQPSNTGGRVYEVEYRIVLPDQLNLILENTNGAFDIRFVTGSVSVDNVNGEISLLDLTGQVAVELVNGQISADLNPADDPAIALTTVNGRVELTVPTSISALLIARVVNGNIDVSNLNLTGVTQNATTLQATIGAGAGTIDLETVNGDVRVLGR